MKTGGTKGVDEMIRIINARENNLKSVTLDIPKNKLVVVTGVSGSGKSSLIFDVLYREAEFRYFGSFSSYTRLFLGKIKRPDVERIEGLSPAVAVNQGPAVNNPRSTVGTISGIYDHLRLLFARTGYLISGIRYPISRSLFSFNTPEGACPQCKGLGLEDRLDPELLIEDATKSIRQRAMTITTPNGYIMYSQVTLDVLDQVCRAEGFNIDIPWKDLSPENKHVIFYGSDKIEIPFGKHPLESRMKWSGITAKPREMGVYKGVIPVMEEILKRDRNKNILRFVRTACCSVCGGKRLNPLALSVKVGGWDIGALSAMPVTEMSEAIAAIEFPLVHKPVAGEILSGISSLVKVMKQLGLAHLSADRESGSLSAGESRRLKLATQLGSGLSGMIYVFDEPSIGLHHTETAALIDVLKQLRDQGNTVIVVEHDEAFIRHADHLIDIGPGPGVNGGNVLVNSAVSDLGGLPEAVINSSKTLLYYFGRLRVDLTAIPRQGRGELRISGASHHNLKNIDVSFLLRALNVVTGVSGSGKASLVHQTLGSFLRKQLSGSNEEVGKHTSIDGWEGIKRLVEIDQSPIGRTPRSNPATYTGMFDHIRDLFAALPAAFERGYGKSRFSFNTQGGRCEDCQGAGYRQMGMHFMGNVEVLCETCNGRRFDQETLEILWKGKNIYDILEMPVSEAFLFFEGEKKITRYLRTMDELGLGYLTLGQRSSTLSGGEAQRVKLAAELLRNAEDGMQDAGCGMQDAGCGMQDAGCRMQDAGCGMQDAGCGMQDAGCRIPQIVHRKSYIVHRKSYIVHRKSYIVHRTSYIVNHTLYILDEPTTGLHNDDVKKLLSCLNGLIDRGHTVICIEHDQAFLRSADRIIHLPSDIRYPISDGRYPISDIRYPASLSLKNVTTHNLKGIDIQIPHERLTVITGVSGSGKSSLAFDTIHAEARNLFLGNFPAYARSRIGMKDKPDFEEIHGLRPTFAVEQRGLQSNPRSTLGTYTGIYDLYRLLFSRAGLQVQASGEAPVVAAVEAPAKSSALNQTDSKLTASTLFSFNNVQGACFACDGLGVQTLCDPEKLITNPERSVLQGAMDGSRTGKFYGDPYGQYTATLKAVGEKHSIDYSLSWAELSAESRKFAMHGCGEENYEVSWEFLRNKRSGTHHFKGRWQGFLQLVNEEYSRKHADHRGEGMMNVMGSIECPECHGSRLNDEARSWVIRSKNIGELSAMSITQNIEFFSRFESETSLAATGPLVTEILRRLNTLETLGLAYLSASRSVGSLSYGEARRLQLAAQTGSGLSGMIYILDEPTAGLHSRDTAKLLLLIRELISEGNTVIAVEHQREVILAADHIIDIGPGAGSLGGEIIAQGSSDEIMNSMTSVTGKYLKMLPCKQPRPLRQLKSGLQIKNAFINNLKNFDVEIPSGGIICITGVSGSGKSSLMLDLIHDSWRQGKAVGCSDIKGFDSFSSLVTVEQNEEFSSPVAVVATYSGAFDLIRKLFASSIEAESGGFSSSHFSFLNKQTQCPSCSGMGKTRISMDFMPDVLSECETCLGKRYNPEILQLQWQGKDISEVLELSGDEAIPFFTGQKNLLLILDQLEEAGLGYLRLGQPLNTLSGGEAQRLHLCREIINIVHRNSSIVNRPSSIVHRNSSIVNRNSYIVNRNSYIVNLPHPSSLYLFDEPTTGLHFADIENLLKLFHRLADAGNTLIIIEHDQQIISEADFIIELGPEGGDRGGYLISDP